jgi:hypothetical protein
MTYAMTLDNSWELMTEDEMYDVNGGGVTFSTTKVFGIIIGAEIQVSNDSLDTLLGLIASGITFAAVLKLLGVSATVAAPLAAVGLLLYGTLQLYSALGWGIAWGYAAGVSYSRPIF